MLFCVICKSKDNGSIRIVGPFSALDETVAWATHMNNSNSHWDYTTEILDPPTN